MDFEPFDSSGTDDDLPPSHRAPRGGRIVGNGRSAVASAPYPKLYGESEMETQIHQLEQEAYCAVLRAFKAQADAITWEKESVITELRKELRLTNEEHRELLSRVNADDMIKRIREWRQSGGVHPGMLNTGQTSQDLAPSPTVSASRKKQKTAHSVPSQSYTGPGLTFNAQAAASHQPSLAAANAKRGSMMGSKSKKQRPGLPAASSGKPIQYPLAPTGRGQIGNRVSLEATPLNEPAQRAAQHPLIGRRVRTRWPDDNNFYEATITQYNPDKGLHLLVYDINTENETWEWVNLNEISREDIEWVEGDPRNSHRGSYGVPSRGMTRPVGREGVPDTGRGAGSARAPSRKDILPSQNGVGMKKAPDDIQIRRTDTLLEEVERVFGSNHPNPLEVQKAKKALKDQEQALMAAIAMLAEMSDRESDEAVY